MKTPHGLHHRNQPIPNTRNIGDVSDQQAGELHVINKGVPMVILMQHPEHGMMHVYLEAEAQANEKNGWKRVTDVGSMTVTAAATVVATPEPVPDELIPPSFIKRGRGRPRKDA